jgi:hypothetical protein
MANAYDAEEAGTSLMFLLNSLQFCKINIKHTHVECCLMHSKLIKIIKSDKLVHCSSLFVFIALCLALSWRSQDQIPCWLHLERWGGEAKISRLKYKWGFSFYMLQIFFYYQYCVLDG